MAFQSFNFVSPKQKAFASHIQHNYVKYNNKNNTGVQKSIISVICNLGCKICNRIV